MKTYVAKLVKGGHPMTIEVQARTQSEAKKIAENMCKTTYVGYKVSGPPQPKK